MKSLKKITFIFITIMISILLLSNANVLAISTIVNENVDTNQEDNAGSMQNYARSSEGEPVTTSDISEISDDEHNHEDGELGYNPEDIHEGDLYIITGSDYVMDKLVDGNVYIFAKNVKVTGQVNGSIFICSSGNIEVDENAYVACQMFAFADEINIKGIILDLYTASKKLELGENTVIYRQINAFAEEMNLAGTVGRDVNVTSEKIDVSGEKFMVYGNLNYEAKSEIANQDRLDVQGETNFSEAKEKKESVAEVVAQYVFGAIGTVIFDILLYIALIFFAPKFVEKSKEYVSTRGILAFAIGIAFLVAVPFISFALMLTGFLAGLSMFMLFIYGAVLMINAFVIVVIANEFIAGKIKLEDKVKKGFLLVPVSLVLWAIRKIPVIGFWISMIVCVCGLGVVILYQFDKRKEAK